MPLPGHKGIEGGEGLNTFPSSIKNLGEGSGFPRQKHEVLQLDQDQIAALRDRDIPINVSLGGWRLTQQIVLRPKGPDVGEIDISPKLALQAGSPDRQTLEVKLNADMRTKLASLNLKINLPQAVFTDKIVVRAE